jgi:C-terminal processing protease CtpA/Prc
LRSNTGGNMWPMLAGLKPFLGSAGLGTFESPTGSSPKWVAGQSVGVEPPEALGVLENAWVAVLTGPRTASSGEAVTIAFRGRPHTRSFGLPTAGLSTANGTFPLPDGAMILLTTAVEADRTGRKYGDKIDPDVRVEAGTTAAGDAVLAAATQWLGQRCVH